MALRALDDLVRGHLLAAADLDALVLVSEAISARQGGEVAAVLGLAVAGVVEAGRVTIFSKAAYAGGDEVG